MRQPFRPLLVAALIASLSSLAGAADPKASRFYEDALARYEKNDMAGAIIQLKNALQIDKSMLAAHVLMGKAAFTNGDLPAAEASFEEALRLGVNKAEVVVPLGRVYLMQGKYETLLDRISTGGLPSPLQAEVLVLRSSAHAERGNKSTALKILEEARAANPNSIGVRLAQANTYIRMGELAKAAAIADETIAMAPSDASAWNAKASILHVRGDLSGALAAYGKAIALDPAFVDARIARTGLLLDLKRPDEASKELGELQRIAPDDPRAAYLRSIIAASRGDSPAVKAALVDITKLLDPVPSNILFANRQMLFLAGLAHFGLSNHEKATSYLSVYLRQFPGDPGATKLLASLLLDQGERSRAITLLEALLRNSPNDPQALSLLAQAYLQEKNYRQASELLDRAVKLTGGDSNMRTNLGLSLLGAGKGGDGMEQLLAAFNRDPKLSRAGLAIATVHLQSGNPKRALEFIDRVIKADPDNLSALIMQGIARVASGDRASGRRSYENVLARDAGHQAAILNLAKLDADEGKTDAARQRLNQMLRSDAKNIDAMVELAGLEERAGNLKEAFRWLEKIRDLPTGGARGSILLAEAYLREGNNEQALSVAKDARARAPEDLTALTVLVRAQLAANDRSGARQTLADMARFANFNPGAQLEIARLQVAANNLPGAIYSLEKALANQPDWLPALVLYTEIEIRQGELGKAEAHAKLIADKNPGAAAAARLQGDLALARKQYAAALTHYGNALRKENSTDIALRIYHIHIAAGDSAKGIAFLEKRLRELPGDMTIQRVLADAYLVAGNLAGARSHYERLLKTQPDNPYLLNNLAQTALRQKDKAAIDFAERAVRQRPNDPLLIDTLGWILVTNNQLERGLGLLRDARLRLPGHPEIHYHLGSALAQSGRESEAREELRKALENDARFEGHDDARKLLQRLGRTP